MSDVIAPSGWRLVPDVLPREALSFLINFDMESIGNGHSDGADECWAGLLDRIAKAIPRLEFSNPVFHPGTNTTVRRGDKWCREELAVIHVGNVDCIVKLRPITHPFNLLTDHWLRDEHDPSCRTVDGLLTEMQRVYPGFKPTEKVTVINFELPMADSPQEASDA